MVAGVVEACVEALQRARERVRELLGSGLAGRRESRGFFGDVSLLADLECERVIMETLESRLGKIAFVAEERGIVNDSGNPDYVAVIDPVDGSNNLASGIPFYSSAIAIATGDKFRDVVAGVAMDYTTGCVYYAVKDGEAYRDGGKLASPRVKHALNESFISLDPRMLKKTPNEAVNLIKNTKNVRFFGSSVLEILMVAEGKLDAFIAYPKIMRVVDFTAPLFIAERAGVCVWMLERELGDVDLITRERYGFVTASSRELCGEILERLSSSTNNFSTE